VVITTDLAAVLLAEADAATLRRKALLCARVAVITTSSAAGARKVLAAWDGPAEVRTAALAVLDQISHDLDGGTR
jgi:hypothetical protein